LNVVEIVFGVITCHCLTQTSFASIPELEAAENRYIERYNEDAKPPWLG